MMRESINILFLLIQIYNYNEKDILLYYSFTICKLLHK